MSFRRLWQYTLIVAMLMLVVGIATDTKDVERYASRMEKLMADGDYEKALTVGDRSDKTDRKLMMLRIEALGHEHLLGERLFAYPMLKGQGSGLVARGGDYELCGYLIDKQLDRFVAALPRYYKIDTQLPRYYREALVQYCHLRANPAVVFHDAVLDADYQDMQQLERQHKAGNARQMAVFQQYEGTYWYFYEYL